MEGYLSKSLSERYTALVGGVFVWVEGRVVVLLACWMPEMVGGQAYLDDYVCCKTL